MVGYAFTIFGLTVSGPIPDGAQVSTYTMIEDPMAPGMAEGFRCLVDFDIYSPYAYIEDP